MTRPDAPMPAASASPLSAGSSLRLLFTPALALVALLAASLGAWAYYQLRHDALLSQAQARLIAATEQKSDAVNTWRAERLADANAFVGISSNYPEGVPLADDAKLNALVKLLGGASTSFRGISPLVLDPERRPLPGQSSPEDASVLFRPQAFPALVQMGETGRTAEIPAIRDESGKFHVYWIAPIRSSSGPHLAGSALLRLRTSDLVQEASPRWTQQNPHTRFSLWREDERELQMMFSSEGQSPQSADDLKFYARVFHAAQNNRRTMIRSDGEPQLLAVGMHVPDTPWVMMVTEPYGIVARPLLVETVLCFFVCLATGILAGLLVRAAFRDRAEKREREQTKALQALATRSRAIMDTASDGIHILDTEGRFVEVNHSFCLMVGYSREELVGMSIVDIDPDLTPETFRSNFRALSAGSGRFERRHRRKNGTMVEVEVSANRVLYDGKVLIYGSSRDIGARKLAESSLRRLFRVVEQAQVSVVLTDLDGVIEYVNPHCLALLGYKSEELIGKHSRIFSSGETPKHAYEDMWRTLRAGETWTGEFVNKRKDGSRFIERAVITPVHDDEGKTVSYAAIKEDITAQREHEIQLARLNRLHEILGGVGDLLARERGADEMMQGVCDLLVKGGFRAAWAGWHEPTAQTLEPRAQAGADVGMLLRSIPLSGPDAANEKCPLVAAFLGGSTAVCNAWSQTTCGVPQLSGLSAIGLPLRVQGSVTGVLAVFAHTRDYFHQQEVNLLTRVAENLSFALDALEVDSQRLMTEHQLRESEQRFRDLFDLESDAILLIDVAAGCVLMANRAAGGIYSAPAADLVGARATRFNGSKSQPDFPTLVRDMPLDEVQRIPLRWQRRFTGEIFPAEISYRLFRRGESLMAVVAVRDITEQERAREQLQALAMDLENKVNARTEELAERNRELDALLQAVPDMVLRMHRDGRVLFWQPPKAGEGLIHLCAGLDVAHATDEGLLSFARSAGLQSLERQMMVMTEASVTPQEENVSLEFRAAPSGADAFVVFVRDVTIRQKMEALMSEALRKEREASAMKSRFISVTSHEFRTPMSAALSASDLLTNHPDQLSPTQRQTLLTRIDSSMRRMSQMLDDLLTLNRATSGRLKATLAEVDLRGLVEEIIEELRMSEPVKHRFNLKSEGDCSGVTSDSEMLRHVLSNLIGNAMRYSSPGSLIEIRIKAEDGGFAVAVMDRGIGIPAADQGRLFAPFERGSNTTGIVGSGLGLSIAREVSEILGGQISFVSEVGVGSIFTVSFGEVRIEDFTLVPAATARADSGGN